MNKQAILELKEKDPQRFWGTVIILSVIILTLIGGIIYSVTGGGDEEIRKDEVVAIEVPVDTMALNNDDKYQDDYFEIDDENSENGSDLGGDSESSTEVQESNYTEPRKVYSPKPSGYYSSNNVPVKSDVVSSSPVEVEKKSKKRTPSDGFSSTGKTDNTMCKIVVDNRSRTVKSGSTVYFHSANDFVLSGVKVPKNTMIQGLASIQGERVRIVVTQLRIGKDFYNVNWKVYDSGIEGIYVPEKLGDNVAKDGVDQTLDQGTKIETNVPVVGSVKLNLKKKNQESSVVLPDGYKCTLHE